MMVLPKRHFVGKKPEHKEKTSNGYKEVTEEGNEETTHPEEGREGDEGGASRVHEGDEDSARVYLDGREVSRADKVSGADRDKDIGRHAEGDCGEQRPCVRKEGKEEGQGRVGEDGEVGERVQDVGRQGGCCGGFLERREDEQDSERSGNGEKEAYGIEHPSTAEVGIDTEGGAKAAEAWTQRGVLRSGRTREIVREHCSGGNAKEGAWRGNALRFPLCFHGGRCAA